MVGATGMVGSLINVSAAQGTTTLVAQVISDATSRAALEELLVAQKEVARQVLVEHRQAVVRLRDALLERHELVGEEILAVISDDQIDLRVVPVP